LKEVLRNASDNKGDDKEGYRAEFVQLVQQAMHLGMR
jgi:hypothetical protein